MTYLLPINLWEPRLNDVPTPTDPAAGYASDISDVTMPLGRSVTPGSINTSQTTGSDSDLASPLR
jgi:hypothetical protein